MGGESDDNVAAAGAGGGGAVAEDSGSTMDANVEEKPRDGKKKPEDESKKKNKKKGVFGRMWNGLFGSRKDDFEQRLERIWKEEKAIISRMRKRAQSWGSLKRHIILFSVALELVAIGYAIMTARTAEDWQDRALRVLPMFLLPVLSAALYSATSSYVNMREQKDQKTLEKLQSERQSKIDGLKERTNFYVTLQLIQQYDTDPAAKAAASAVLASKYAEGSGLKLLHEEESKADSGKSNDVELVQHNGLRNRKQPQGRATSPGGTMIQHSDDTTPYAGNEYAQHDQHNQQLYVDHYQGQGATAYNSGWLSRIAALLVGEDPTQCYALICGNCHMHNGLASKEDFPYVTYICPHCHAVIGPRIQQQPSSSAITSNVASAITGDHEKATSSVDFPHDNLVNPDIAKAAPVPAEAIEKTEVSTEGTES